MVLNKKIAIGTILLIVAILGVHGLFFSENPIFKSDNMLAQGALPEAHEHDLVTYFSQFSNYHATDIAPGTIICPSGQGYQYCLLHVWLGRDMIAQPVVTIAPGYGNPSRYSGGEKYGILVGVKLIDIAYTREYLGTNMAMCPLSYVLCKTINEYPSMILPLKTCMAGENLETCVKGILDYEFMMRNLQESFGPVTTHYYGYKLGNVKCMLGTTKCDGNELYKCERLTDDSIDWVSKGSCNDNKPCTTDTCVNGKCRYTPISDYCGHCQTVDEYCNCIPKKCIGVGGIEYNLGMQETRTCGMCGTETRTCDYNTCEWTNWGTCLGQGTCAPYTTKSCEVSGIPGQQTCTDYCSWGICDVTGECVPNSKRCSGNNLQKCDAYGNWQNEEYCQYGCNIALGECKVCNPGTPRCDGNIRQVCSGDGMEWTFIEQCSIQCKDGVCMNCQLGSYRCNGDMRQYCVDGFNWNDYELCESGCENTACRFCSPGESVCDNYYLKTCSVNGLAWISNYCQHGCDPLKLKCNTMCTPNEKRCYGVTLQKCSYDGMSWDTIQACPHGCTDNKCITPDCGDNPMPFTYNIVYCMASAGETCESCPEDCGYCPLSLSVQLEPNYLANQRFDVPVSVDGTSQSVIIHGKITNTENNIIHPEVTGSSVNGVATLSFNVQRSGSFILSVRASHPGSHQEIIESKTIHIKSPLFMKLVYDDTQYMNEEVVVVATVTDSSNRQIDLDTLNVEVTINNRKISCSPDVDCWELTGGGEYTISTIIPPEEGEGYVIITITAGKSGYESITKSASFIVDKPGIQISFSEDSPPRDAEFGDNVNIKVYVSTPQNVLFDADSVELEVTKPNQQTEILKMTRVTKGTYVTGYKLDQLELHTFKVTVKKTGFTTTSEETNTAVGGGPGPIDWLPSLWTIIQVVLLLGGIYLVSRWFKNRSGG